MAESSIAHYSVVAYIPALHRGYLDFFKKYPGTLYILDTELVREVPRLERDIRALTPEEIKSFLEGAEIFSKIIVLEKNNLQEFLNDPNKIIMPDEDVSRHFAETYLAPAKKTPEFVSIFLRWDGHNAKKAFQVSPDRTISSNEFDREMIVKATKESAKSADWWRTIGCVIVKDGRVLFATHNHPLPSDYVLDAFGDPRSNFDYGDFEHYKTIHAEAAIIAEAARRGIPLENACLYATTFPCPNCARLIGVAGIKEVYYATGYSALDAEDILKSFGVKIVMVK
jgi:dCMP deaminase